MNEAIYKLADGYLSLLAWFITGMTPSLIPEAYQLKTDIEAVLRKLTGTQLTGVELARCAKDKYRHDEVPEG